MDQVWKHRAAPLLWDHLTTQVDSVDAYTLLYHEAALTTLLEVRPADCTMHQSKWWEAGWHRAVMAHDSAHEPAPRRPNVALMRSQRNRTLVEERVYVDMNTSVEACSFSAARRTSTKACMQMQGHVSLQAEAPRITHSSHAIVLNAPF
jgi:hypothetical protein